MLLIKRISLYEEAGDESVNIPVFLEPQPPIIRNSVTPKIGKNILLYFLFLTCRTQ